MNRHDVSRDGWQLFGKQAREGYDWWWHSFTGRDEETSEERAFFIEFFTCNPALGEKEAVLGQLEENKRNGKRPSYVMVKAGAWGGDDRAQLHRFFGWGDAKVEKGVPFAVEVGDCQLDERHTRGCVKVTKEDQVLHPEWMCGSGEMEWDLAIEKVVAFNVGWGASRPMRWLQLFEMFWHAEGMKSRYDGWVKYNGRRYVVKGDESYGYADKNWGKGFTTPWVWLSSCCLVSEFTGKVLTDSVFDIGGGRPIIGGLVLNRKLLADFWYEGRSYEFNFSKFWSGCRTKFDCRETDDEVVWHVEQRTWTNKMVTDIRCKKADMLLVNYEDPKGEKRHNRLWNGGNGYGTVELYHCGKLVDKVRASHVGCEYGEYDC